jgi:purine-cytosine permease-like protein
LFWPDIKTVKDAKTARVPALAFSIFSTVLYVIMTITTIFGYKSLYGYYVFLHLTFFAAVSVGLYKMRREASIAYLVVCTVAVIFAWGHILKLLAAFAGVFVSLFAVRGTFSYVHLSKEHNQRVHSDAPKGGA